MGAPGWYSLINAIAKASGSTAAQAASRLRRFKRKAGRGGGAGAPASYEAPKNATRRRAITPRISKFENSTAPIAAASSCSSGTVTKFGR
jgi:hypothetical protein